jgi:hypothetical protein
MKWWKRKLSDGRAGIENELINGQIRYDENKEWDNSGLGQFTKRGIK